MAFQHNEKRGKGMDIKGKIAIGVIAWLGVTWAYDCAFPPEPEPAQTKPASVAVAPVVDTKPRVEPEKAETSKDDLRLASEIKFRQAIEAFTQVESCRVTPEDTLVIVVDQSWLLEPKALRLQAAQQFGKIWKRLDHTNLGVFSIVDMFGNEVGGYGFAGVWVNE